MRELDLFWSCPNREIKHTTAPADRMICQNVYPLICDDCQKHGDRRMNDEWVAINENT